MSTPAHEPISPEFRTWLEHEEAWARHALRAVAKRRELVAASGGAMDRFALRMSLVELTGAVAGWAHGLAAGLEKVGRREAGAALAAGPPFPAADVTVQDCDLLGSFIDGGVAVIRRVLNEAPPD